jgi:transposase
MSGRWLGLFFLLGLGLVRPRADDRMVLNGILYVLTTGCRWCDMPAEYGSEGEGLRRCEYGTVYLRPWPL